ncbi:MAG TPA: MerR family transcriptional regulator [Acidimicrobiales bacterium]|nr:MerR family transcriptional regulator [Acidimicrobiales bacterium]
MEDRAFLSIGEVLSLLKEEFPDVTISKIRFLESQGLLDPERTPSGYRKFYDTDVERLRWILRQQRENFLPLKVIKGRLRGGGELTDDADDLVASASSARSGATATAAANPGSAAAEPPPMVVRQSGASLNITELAAATGLEEDDLRELERFGLLNGRRVGSAVYYDEEAVSVAGLAAGFMKYGVEPRHLRMYKTTADREAGFFEQVVMPMLKQRNPQARRQAVDTLAELARLGQGLRQAMLREALRQYFERP